MPGKRGRGRSKNQRKEEPPEKGRGRGRGRGLPPDCHREIGNFPSLPPRPTSEFFTIPDSSAEPICHDLPASSPLKEHRQADRTILKEELGLELKEKSALIPVLPKRPKNGNLGRRIQLISNCYQVKIPSGNVYHYDVIITERPSHLSSESEMFPSEDKKYKCLNTKKNRKVIAHLLDNYATFSGCYGAFDGKSNLYTREELQNDFPLIFVVTLPNDCNDDSQKLRQAIYDVTITPVKKFDTMSCAINLDSIHAFYDKKTSTIPEEAIMAVETILRNGPCMRLTPIGRSFFYKPDPGCLNPIGGGLEIWFGYHQSVRIGEWKPIVNLDIAATAFLQEGPVLNYLADLLNVHVEGLHRMPILSDADVKKINAKLHEKEVRVTHLKYRRRYRIVRLAKSAKDEYMSSEDKSGKMSIAQYFKHHHGKILEFPNLPCLQVKPAKREVYLPIEVCVFTPGQHYKAELTREQKAEMIKFTSVPPKQRFQEIDGIVKDADFRHDKSVQGFNLEVSNSPLRLEGRVLDSPSLLYKDKHDAEKQIRPEDGSWNIQHTHFLNATSIRSWILLSFGNNPNLTRFAERLVFTARSLGIKIDRPLQIKPDNKIDCDKKTLLSEVKKRADLAVVVIPATEEFEKKGKKPKGLYAEVKKAAETVVGLITQCIKEKTLEEINSPRGSKIISNLCLKINTKMGGENNSLVRCETPAILWKPAIIIGADVNHPAPTDTNQNSIAACVGSLDSCCKRCAVSIRSQKNTDGSKKTIEIIYELKDMVLELLKEFYRCSGKKPEKIIFYRDGVSEGEFAAVKYHEVVCIREACRTLPEYEPEITFIVLQKNHHLRFKPKDPRDGTGKLKNIPSGTVIDTEVTHPINFDFLLCSQAGLQGTSRPSHYTVIEDDNDFSANDLQKLTYQLCHMYARCTKSIKIPAPVAYAHLAAYRARKHLEGRKNSDLDINLEDVAKEITVLKTLRSSMYFV